MSQTTPIALDPALRAEVIHRTLTKSVNGLVDELTYSHMQGRELEGRVAALEADKAKLMGEAEALRAGNAAVKGEIEQLRGANAALDQSLNLVNRQLKTMVATEEMTAVIGILETALRDWRAKA